MLICEERRVTTYLRVVRGLEFGSWTELINYLGQIYIAIRERGVRKINVLVKHDVEAREMCGEHKCEVIVHFSNGGREITVRYICEEVNEESVCLLPRSVTRVVYRSRLI